MVIPTAILTAIPTAIPMLTGTVMVPSLDPFQRTLRRPTFTPSGGQGGTQDMVITIGRLRITLTPITLCILRLEAAMLIRLVLTSISTPFLQGILRLFPRADP